EGVDCLLQLSSPDLENRGLRSWRLADCNRRECAQLRVLERSQLDLQRRQLAREIRVLEERRTVVHRTRRFLPEPLDAIPGAGDAGDVRPFMLQENLAIGPAFAFFPDQIGYRHLDILEVDL